MNISTRITQTWSKSINRLMRYEARGKFEVLERCVKVARGAAKNI